MKDPLLYPERPPSLASARHCPLALWHLLSLDAPTVATLWTWFIAHCAGVHLSATSLASMFASVWLLYAADRLLDARSENPPQPVAQFIALSAMSETRNGSSGPPTDPGAPSLDSETWVSTEREGKPQPSELELRHHFHHNHRRAFLSGIAVAGVLLAAMLPSLPPADLRLYALLGALLISWFLIIHTRLTASSRLPKELAVGIFFPAAVFIPTVAAHPELRVILLGPALIFGSLCTLNCVLLYAWEHPTGSPNAHWTTRLALTRLRPNAWSLLLASFLLYEALSSNWLARLGKTFASQALDPAPFTPLATACFLSVALLITLDRYRSRLSPVHLRATADLALLTPVLWLVLSKNT